MYTTEKGEPNRLFILVCLIVRKIIMSASRVWPSNIWALDTHSPGILGAIWKKFLLSII